MFSPPLHNLGVGVALQASVGMHCPLAPPILHPSYVQHCSRKLGRKALFRRRREHKSYLDICRSRTVARLGVAAERRAGARGNALAGRALVSDRTHIAGTGRWVLGGGAALLRLVISPQSMG